MPDLRTNSSLQPPMMTAGNREYGPRSPLSCLVDAIACIYNVALQVIGHLASFFQSKNQTADVASIDTIAAPVSASADPVMSPQEEQFQLFSIRDCSISEKEKADIEFIIKTLANESSFSMPVFELRKRGKELSHLHPFVYLSYVLNNEELFTDFQKMKTRSFGIIWAQYADEFASKLDELHKQNDLLPLLHSFAECTSRDFRRLLAMISSRSFRAFTDCLAEPPSPPASATSRDESLASPLLFRSEEIPQTPLRRSMRSSSQRIMRREAPMTPSQRASPLQAAPFPVVVSQQPAEVSSSSFMQHVLQLPMHELHKHRLRKIFEDVATMSPWPLLFQIRAIKADWDKLKEVHPLRLLVEVFCDPVLFSHLTHILEMRMRRDHFLSDFALTLKEGATREQRAPYIEDFCRMMNIDAKLISPSLIIGEERDFKHLIRLLMGIKQLEAQQRIIPRLGR